MAASLQLTSNRTGKRTGNRLGAGCLALFALPFAAVGVGAFAWGALTLLDWRAASGWVEVPAELVNVTLEEHDGDDSTTYQTTATYRYEYAGRTYDNHRVAIDTGSDNIGDFQQRLYYELRAAHERGATVTAYVDPAKPANAVLNRELRFGMLALKGVFAFVFGGVGFGLLFGARYGAKKLAAQNALREQFPDEPWRWRPEWANGRIASSARGVAHVAIGFAVLWNLISLPLLFVLPDEIAGGNTAAAIGLLFPLIGVGLAAWAIRSWLQLKRFKVATLTLDRMPVALGGRLKGTIRVESAVPVTTHFRLELACVETRTTGSGKNRSSHERLLWQKHWRMPRHQCQITAAFTTIPVDAPVPAGQPTTTVDDASAEIAWRLDVTGECPGPDFWSRFELPVFATETPPAAAELPPAIEPTTNDGPGPRELDALGIDYERLPQGGEAWTFRRGRNKDVARGLSAFAALWTAICGVLFVVDAPLLFRIVFPLSDALLIWWALELWLTEYRVTLDHGLLTLSRRGFMARAPIEIPLKWLRGVQAQVGMQAGNKLYYDLKVDTADGSHTAASSLADHDVASWLARHWMAGGATLQR
jgi:hypothetical protein